MVSKSARSRHHPRSRKLELAQAAPWIWLALLAGIVALLGGSSRPDAVQIAALRPLAALFLIPAFYYLSLAQLRETRMLVWLLGLLAVWMVLQIVPLPPSVWQGLPGRDVLAELDRAVGVEDTWRPISFVPSRGWNALASLVVPVVALLLALSMRARPRMLLLLVAGLGLFDALLGLLQVISGSGSPLYFYTVTNRGSPVGIFANENHSAVFSAITLIVIARLGVTAKALKEVPWLRLAYPPAFVIVLLAVLVSGSRAGLAMAILSLIASGLMIWLALASGRSGRRGGRLEKWLAAHPRALLLVFVGVIGGLLGAFFGLERAPGFEDIFTSSPIEDLRWQLWPLLEQMIGTYWLLGAGFGSFEEFYHIYEPTELLLPNYVNQAHNDWAQLVIEGGLPAFGILIALFGWIAVSLRALLRAANFALGHLIFWGAAIAILCAASIVDYPLRVPVLQLVAVWLLLALALETSRLDEVE